MTPVPTPPDLRALTTLRFFAALWVVLYTAWPHLDVGFTPVAVAFNCWINRRTRARIFNDGRVEVIE